MKKITIKKTSMNMKQLQAILAFLKVPDTCYNLDGRMHDSRCCYEQSENMWIVYDGERGSRFRECHYDNETDACLEILKRMMHLGC